MTTFLSLFLIVQISSAQKEVQWMTWEEAIEKHSVTPKKLYIDIYTDWCGWCKKMENTTFRDKEIVSLLNKDFYPIKLNAERKDTIIFDNHDFIFRDDGRRGVHELALSLVNGQLGYPSFVILDEDFARVLISPGYKERDAVIKELYFAKEEAYKHTDFESFDLSRK